MPPQSQFTDNWSHPSKRGSLSCSKVVASQKLTVHDFGGIVMQCSVQALFLSDSEGNSPINTPPPSAPFDISCSRHEESPVSPHANSPSNNTRIFLLPFLVFLLITQAMKRLTLKHNNTERQIQIKAHKLE